MPGKPDFTDASWNNTMWSLWGMLYTGAESDTALKTAISQTFGDVRKELKKLGRQVNPLAARVQEWWHELNSYARTIKYGEANSVLERLKVLLVEVSEQVQTDSLLVKSGKKPAAEVVQVKPKPKPSKQSADDDMSDEAWALRSQNLIIGHSKATAKSKPKIVKAKPYVPPTPDEEWEYEQRTMANNCDSGIDFGTHEVNQHSVIRHLGLATGDSIIKQYREGPATNHLRIMKSRNGEQFWTLGLTHREKRDVGEFSVYRRVGAKSQFVYVSGERHPRDPGP